MANFPSSLDTYTTVAGTILLTSGDGHAGIHNNAGSQIVAIETNIGTNSGTNILKNFAAGNFPVRINSSNVLQQAISGTINSSTLGTPTIQGAVVTEANLNLTDLTTADVGTAKHGLAPKAPNDATKFLNGVGAWTVPVTGAAGETMAIGTTSGPTTTSTGYVQLEEMKGTIVTTGGNVLVMFDGQFLINDASKSVYVGVQKGTVTTVEVGRLANTTINEIMYKSFSYLFTSVAAGTNTFQVNWCVNGGTATADGTDRRIVMMEI